MADRLRIMTEADLGQVLRWRNHPQVRIYMYQRREISLQEHTDWFAKSSSDPAIELLVYELEGAASGFARITRTRCWSVAEWGFYIAPDAPKGAGHRLGSQVMRRSFTVLGLHKLCGQVIGSNERSIEFHKRLGFKEEGRLRQQHHDGDIYQDVVCFGLLASEWQLACKERFE